MTVSAAYAVPHPPLIVPGVGRGDERKIQKTVNAYEEVGRRMRDAAPDAVVVTSPHAPLYRDGFFVSSTPRSVGSMRQFGAPQESLAAKNDEEFQRLLTSEIELAGYPVAGSYEAAEELDHAAYVPLHFIKDLLERPDAPKIIRVGLSGLSPQAHREVGRAIAKSADKLGRNIVLVASGDLSHKLKPEGPYGFDPAGPVFDAKIAEIFDGGSLGDLFILDEQMCDDAAECGLRSFQIMAGALEEAWEGEAKGELLSYEGPFGVGYGVAAFEHRR